MNKKLVITTLISFVILCSQPSFAFYSNEGEQKFLSDLTFIELFNKDIHILLRAVDEGMTRNCKVFMKSPPPIGCNLDLAVLPSQHDLKSNSNYNFCIKCIKGYNTKHVLGNLLDYFKRHPNALNDPLIHSLIPAIRFD